MATGPETTTPDRMFAIVTAAYHGMPEAHELIEELDEREAKDALWYAAQLIRGAALGLEARKGLPSGAVLEQIALRRIEFGS